MTILSNWILDFVEEIALGTNEHISFLGICASDAILVVHQALELAKDANESLLDLGILLLGYLQTLKNLLVVVFVHIFEVTGDVTQAIVSFLHCSLHWKASLVLRLLGLFSLLLFLRAHSSHSLASLDQLKRGVDLSYIQCIWIRVLFVAL